MSLKANEILEKIEKMEYSFWINESPELTSTCKRYIREENWKELRQKNESNLPQFSEPEEKTDSSFSVMHKIDMNAFNPYLNPLREYKDVTKKIPSDTRFKSVKNVINRMILVTTRYQEIFNNHLVEALNFFVRKIQVNEQNFIHHEEKLKQMEQEMQQMSHQMQDIKTFIMEGIETKLKAIESQTDQKMTEIYNRLKDVELCITDNSNYLEEMDERITDNSNWLEKTNERITDNSNWLEKTNERITENSNWLEKTNERITENSNWLEKTNERITENSNWLEKTNERITENSNWLKGTNKRIDDSLKWIESTNNRITEGNMYHDIESLRKELFAEIRYELSISQHGSIVSESDRKNQEPLFLSPYEEYCKKYGNVKKLNLGCGLVQKEDYLNIDGRALEGVAIAADVQNLPFKENEIDEIYAAHLLEHFELKKLYSELIPYWFSLLKKGGIIRLVVPNIGLMTKKYVQGEIPFAQYREVVFGGQEYVGNYHYTMFDEEELHKLLKSCGLKEIETVVSDRVNGLSFEIEVTGKKG